jgi:hypothetical protein
MDVDALVEATYGDRESDAIGATKYQECGRYENCLVYGEPRPSALLALMKSVAPARAGPMAFADLGCGEGVPCVVAAASGLFSRIVGIELVDVRGRTGWVCLCVSVCV